MAVPMKMHEFEERIKTNQHLAKAAPSGSQIIKYDFNAYNASKEWLSTAGGFQQVATSNSNKQPRKAQERHQSTQDAPKSAK